MATRSEAQSTTKYSPHFLLFKRKKRLPVDLYDFQPLGKSASAKESVANLRQVLLLAHENETANMQSSQ